jgi:hypothetical protein
MKQLWVCALLVAGMSSAWATEYGNVVSVNPVIQRSAAPQPSCTYPNGTAIPGCETGPVTQSTVVGYQIQYLYKGQTYSAQVPSDPGKTVALRFDQSTGNPIPAVALRYDQNTGEPIYSGDPSVQLPTTVVVASPPPPAYVYPPYYGPAYYGPAFYGPPVIGVGIGIGFHGGWGGGWGGGWRR